MNKYGQTRSAAPAKIRETAFASHRVLLYLAMAALIINLLIK